MQRLERRRMFSAVDAGVDGIAVLGDSYSDEYQFYPPDRSSAMNWVEQLADDSHASFGAFSADDPAGPRNAGYAYNWAVSGATSNDMIAAGQLGGGVLEQVMSGDVDLVSVFIGGNDFRDVFTTLATQGPEAAIAHLQVAVPTVATNIAIATGTILSPPVLAANPDARVVLITIPKLSYLPEVKRQVEAFPPLAAFVAAVDQAVVALNEVIRGIAAGAGGLAGVADFAALSDSWFVPGSKLKVGNVALERDALFNPDNDARHLVLADGLHSGTLVQGLLANLIVETANTSFGTAIKPLSTHEILTNAGLKSEPPVDVPVSPFAKGPKIGARVVDDELLGLSA
jgi:hypothetical protein